MSIKRIAVMTAVFFLASCLMVACGPRQVRQPTVGPFTTEQFARGVSDDMAAFLRTAQANHKECSADQPTAGQGICPSLHRWLEINNGLARAINLYCGGAPLPGDEPYGVDTDGSGRGGPCSPVLAVKPELQSVLGQVLLVLAQYPKGAP